MKGWLNHVARIEAPEASEIVTSAARMRPPRPMRISRERSTRPWIVCSRSACSAVIGTTCEKSWWRYG